MSETKHPERPTTGITPFLAIRDGRATEALAFYERAFQAQVIERNVAQDGKRLMQASLKLNNGWIMLSDDFPEHGFSAPPPASVTAGLWVARLPENGRNARSGAKSLRAGLAARSTQNLHNIRMAPLRGRHDSGIAGGCFRNGVGTSYDQHLDGFWMAVAGSND